MEVKTVKFKFEKLRIWKDAMDLGEDIFKISSAFPKEEIYNLTSQIRRASDSIALNISEGSILQSNPEYQRFLGYSIRSIAEVVTCHYKAEKRNYIRSDEFDLLYQRCFDLMNMTIAFRKTLNS
ncbi:four helix bundle protein [Ekhidna sp.]|uniref:four helix bundle protein n=1 Tax=Ekhidna sp. TaxID=2608089 RepID=UPI0032994E63